MNSPSRSFVGFLCCLTLALFMLYTFFLCIFGFSSFSFYIHTRYLPYEFSTVFFFMSYLRWLLTIYSFSCISLYFSSLRLSTRVQAFCGFCLFPFDQWVTAALQSWCVATLATDPLWPPWKRLTSHKYPVIVTLMLTRGHSARLGLSVCLLFRLTFCFAAFFFVPILNSPHLTSSHLPLSLPYFFSFPWSL